MALPVSGSPLSTAGASLATWILSAIFSMFWLVYGIAHEAFPIIATNLLWTVMEVALVAVVICRG